MSDQDLVERPAEICRSRRLPVCSDRDEDCDDIEDKVSCWLYDPCKGRCPFLSSDESE